MRISDWSSDVCSSDLVEFVGPGVIGADELFRAARRAIDEARAAMAADVGEGAHDAVGAAHEDHAFAGIVDAVPVPGVREDRKSVEEGKSVSVRVDFGGRRIIKKKKKIKNKKKT